MTEKPNISVQKMKVATWSSLQDRTPTYALVANVDLVVIRYDENVSVFYGRCLHRGALMSDGTVEGENLICGLHGWDYRLDSGISEYNNAEALHKFAVWIDPKDDAVYVDEQEVRDWELAHPQPFQRNEYLGTYADTHPVEEEPHVGLIQNYAANGLEKTGHHGLVTAMGVSRTELPTWDDIQFVTAQLATPPRSEERV